MASKRLERGLGVAAVLVLAQVLQAQVSVDKSTLSQTIEGFGATITGQYNIRPWSEKQGPFYVQINLDTVKFYDTLISDLGLTAVRTNIDDFNSPSSGQYEVTDNLKELIHDMRKLQDAAVRQDEPLRWIGSLWSPPAWMKVNGEQACAGYTSLDCRLKAGYEDELGAYLVEFVRTMHDSGLDYHAISVQNEPAFLEPYNSCVYNASTYLNAVTIVGQTFAAAGVTQKLFGAEHMSHSFNQFEYPIKQTPEALGYMRAWAVHGYSDGVQSDPGLVDTATLSSKPLWMTETSGSGYGTHLEDWDGAMVAARSIHNYLRAGRLSLWTWWTLNSPDSSSYTMCIHMGGYPTLKWYVTKHFTRYIRPGARQASSSCANSSVDVVAFWHEAAQCLSMVLLNRTTIPQTVNGVSVTGGAAPGQYEKITSTASAKCVSTTVNAGDALVLPAKSITTLVSGTYRGTGSVAALPEPGRTRSVPRTLRDKSVRCVYTLDGRLVTRTDALRARSADRLSRGVYVGVAGHQGAARTTLIAR